MTTPIKVLSVLGTRPEAIKLAPVIKQLDQHDRFDSVVCVTAQHRQMIDQMVALFGFCVDYDLNVMTANQSLSTLTAKLLVALDEVILKEKPDWVLVQGDTTTSYVAALSAFYHKVKVGHVEAGLRSGQIYAPFPEEANRKLISILASMHFAPTLHAKQHLLAENVPEQQIIITGNTVIDALDQMVSHITWQDEWKALFGRCAPMIDSEQVVLITAHRRESFGEGFQNICQAIQRLAQTFPDWHFIYPVHLNPEVRRPVKTILSNIPNVYLIEPLGYEPFVYLLKHCQIVVTDSGGIQEEAPHLGKPVIVMRDKTERTEGVEAGTAKLVGTNVNAIISSVSELINNADSYNRMAQATNPYGDGQAAQRVVAHLY